MRPETHHKKSGVALIMAVGFLAVLILMAIGFAISMRVERLAARNFADVVSSRQFVRTGLTRALADLDTRLLTDPLLTNGAQPSIFWQSGGASNSLLEGWASNYVPPHLQARVRLTDPKWIDIRDKNNALVGRYQYVVVDCSGLIDINFDHGSNAYSGAARMTLTNAMDIRMENSLIPEIPGDTQFGALKNGRVVPMGDDYTPWKRIETVAEMWRYLGNEAQGAGLFTKVPSNFFVYSRFPAGYEVTPNSGVVTQSFPIALTQLQWDQASAATKDDANPIVQIAKRLVPAYQQAGAGAQSTDYAYNLAYSLADYCDSDSIPLTYTNACTEATPLINEFALECEYTQSGDNYTLNAYPRCEVVYPFGGVTNYKPYTLSVILKFTGATAGINPATPATSFQYVYVPNGGSWRWIGPDGMFQISPAAGAPGALPMATATLNVPSPGKPSLVGLKCSVNAFLFEGSVYPAPAPANKPVDGAGISAAQPLVIDLGFMDGKLGAGKQTVGMACNDPRYNAYLNQWEKVGVGGKSLTLNAINTGVATWNSAFGEGVRWMYIANRPLRTPGEIGLLGFAQPYPWRTIDLLDNAGGSSPYVLPVLDLFTVITNSTIRHGLININSRVPGVLACAFNEVGKEAYPGAVADANSSAPATVPASEALQMAAAMIANSPAGASAPSGIRLMGRTWTSWTGPEREAAVRNGANVLGARDSTYSILVCAQALAENGEPIAEQRALAVVWRDRVKTKDSAGQFYNPSFVRYFHWLTD